MVTHPARHSGSSDMETESSMALQCLHGLKWRNGFAPIWTLKLESSVHRIHLVSCTQMQGVMYPILSKLTQIPTWRSLFSSMDFKLSLRTQVQTCCLAPKSMNVVDMSPPRTFCVSFTPCHHLSVLLVPELPSNLFKQHEAFITYMLYNRESFPLLWSFNLEHMKTH